MIFDTSLHNLYNTLYHVRGAELRFSLHVTLFDPSLVYICNLSPNSPTYLYTMQLLVFLTSKYDTKVYLSKILYLISPCIITKILRLLSKGLNLYHTQSINPPLKIGPRILHSNVQTSDSLVPLRLSHFKRYHTISTRRTESS